MLTKEQVKNRLTAKLIETGSTYIPVLDSFTKALEKMNFECTQCNKVISRRYIDVANVGMLSKCECQKKPRKAYVKKGRVIIPPRERWEANNYTVRIHNVAPNLIPIVSTYTIHDKPMKMKCTLCNKTIDKRIGDALKGHNCRNCFGVGFDSNSTASFYILRIDNDAGCIGYKLGITNKKAIERCKWINKSTELNAKVIYEYRSDGKTIQDLERKLKALIPSTGYIPIELMGDGHTETFSGEHIGSVLIELFKLT
ncbi:hypothetical protein ACOJEA_004791 [Klebsiella aerogenes]